MTNSQTSSQSSRARLVIMAKNAMLSAVAVVLMYFEFPLPFAPPFLKMDLSDLPALVAAFSFGPLSGALVELFKNLLHFVVKGTSTAGVGELANFIIGASFVCTAGFIYKRGKSRKSAIIGMCMGGLAMAVAGAITNYFILIPFYVTMMNFPIEAIISMSNKVNRFVTDLPTLIIFAITPFNIVKSAAISVITALIYKRLSPLLHGHR